MRQNLNLNAEKWRNRVFLLAKALFDPLIQAKFQPAYGGRQYFPYSLMEGIAGDISFLSDILKDETSARFPGYEI